jgi:hypothetical protein
MSQGTNVTTESNGKTVDFGEKIEMARRDLPQREPMVRVVRI